MFKGKLIELPQLEHPPLIYETSPLLMIICLCFFNPANPVRKLEDLFPKKQKTPDFFGGILQGKSGKKLLKSPTAADNPGQILILMWEYICNKSDRGPHTVWD